MEQITIQDTLQYLEKIGWSDLIDSRWERQVIKDIVDRFPNITQDVLDQTLDTVLI